MWTLIKNSLKPIFILLCLGSLFFFFALLSQNERGQKKEKISYTTILEILLNQNSESVQYVAMQKEKKTLWFAFTLIIFSVTKLFDNWNLLNKAICPNLKRQDAQRWQTGSSRTGLEECRSTHSRIKLWKKNPVATADSSHWLI